MVKSVQTEVECLKHEIKKTGTFAPRGLAGVAALSYVHQEVAEGREAMSTHSVFSHVNISMISSLTLPEESKPETTTCPEQHHRSSGRKEIEMK